MLWIVYYVITMNKHNIYQTTVMNYPYQATVLYATGMSKWTITVLTQGLCLSHC